MANTNSKPNAKRVCPNCGRKMVQKFIDVKQCKCGISWKEDIGDFQRTPDMAFALQPKVPKKGKKSVRTKKTRLYVIRTLQISLRALHNLETLISLILRNSPRPTDRSRQSQWIAIWRATTSSNPKDDMKAHREALTEAVRAKKSGAVCALCGRPIWAIGTAVVGWNACFTCITGEADCSEDYEIDSV